MWGKRWSWRTYDWRIVPFRIERYPLVEHDEFVVAQLGGGRPALVCRQFRDYGQLWGGTLVRLNLKREKFERSARKVNGVKIASVSYLRSVPLADATVRDGGGARVRVGGVVLASVVVVVRRFILERDGRFFRRARPVFLCGFRRRLRLDFSLPRERRGDGGQL